MSDPVPKVAVIVVGHNDRSWLEPALDSLRRSHSQGSRVALRIWYVDNASTDGSATYVGNVFPAVRVIRNATNLGFAAANNLAIDQALRDGTDYVFLVNPDTYTPPDLLWQVTEFMETWPSYGIVGPLQWQYRLGEALAPRSNDWTISALAAGERHVFAVNRPSLSPPADPGTPRAPGALEHAYVQGAALFVRADMLRRIGAFDEAYHTFYEETDLCRRARLAGWRVALLTGLGIHHHGGGSTTGSSFRREQMMRNKYYFLAADCHLSVADVIAIVWGWVKRDLAGDGVGGRSTRPVALAEFARACAWFAARIPAVISTRRAQRLLREQPRVLFDPGGGGRVCD